MEYVGSTGTFGIYRVIQEYVDNLEEEMPRLLHKYQLDSDK